MTSIQPELWVENAREAIAFYGAAFGATVLHLASAGSPPGSTLSDETMAAESNVLVHDPGMFQQARRLIPKS